MKIRLFAVLGVTCLSLSNASAASDSNALKSLSFSQRNSQTLQSLVSNPDTCRALVQSGRAANTGRDDIRDPEATTNVRIVGACRVVSLNHDGKFQVLCLVDFSGGDGPLSYVAVFKRSGFLVEAEMPVGEGNKNLGPDGLSLEDIRHDGRLEIIEQERSVDVNGHMSTYTDPAPTVTHIYAWRKNTFAQVDVEFRDYFISTTIPRLQQRLALVESSSSALQAHTKEVNALQNSIALANRFFTSGHY